MENGIIYDDGNFSYLKMKQTETEKFVDSKYKKNLFDIL